MEPYTITIEATPLPEEVEAVDTALWEYNQLATADAPLPADWRQLTLLLRNTEGKIVGGLRGETNWGWLFVRKMAIREEGRRQVLGTQLLALAEKEARRRGCHHAYVDTLSFQALPFLSKAGLYGLRYAGPISWREQAVFSTKGTVTQSPVRCGFSKVWVFCTNPYRPRFSVGIALQTEDVRIGFCPEKLVVELL